LAFVCLSGQYFSLLFYFLFCFAATRNDGSQLGLGKQSVRYKKPRIQSGALSLFAKLYLAF
jgi:hypothetical protein